MYSNTIVVGGLEYVASSWGGGGGLEYVTIYAPPEVGRDECTPT